MENVLYKKLPLRFLITSLFYLVVGAIFGIIVTLKPEFRAAHVHLMLLGFVSLTIMGAMYQIVPTFLGVNLRFSRLPDLQFWLSNIGIMGMFFAFLYNYGLLKLFGTIFALASIIFAYMIFDTVFRVKGWHKMSPAGWFFVAAIIYFIVGVILVVLSRLGIVPFNVLAHAHLLVIGWVVITTMGGLHELLPMLALKKLHSLTLAKWQFWLSNVGLVGMFLAFTFDRSYLILSGSIFVVSFYLFFYNMVRSYFQPGDHDEVDISAVFFVYGLFYSVIGVTLGLLNLVYPLRFLHVHFILVGWITLTIIGAMYHIVPMMVWIEKYSTKLGVQDVPMIKDMYNAKLARTLLYSTNAGIILFVLQPLTAYVVMVGGIILLLSFIAFTVEMLSISRR
jgi:cbb3-type cytochrome oxidase subunit 1